MKYRSTLFLLWIGLAGKRELAQLFNAYICRPGRRLPLAAFRFFLRPRMILALFAIDVAQAPLPLVGRGWGWGVPAGRGHHLRLRCVVNDLSRWCLHPDLAMIAEAASCSAALVRLQAHPTPGPSPSRGGRPERRPLRLERNETAAMRIGGEHDRRPVQPRQQRRTEP